MMVVKGLKGHDGSEGVNQVFPCTAGGTRDIILYCIFIVTIIML